jgi:hypothetical protein
MEESPSPDREPEKTRAARIEAMRQRLLALPGQICLRPDDLAQHLEELEGAENLARMARCLPNRGQRIRH